MLASFPGRELKFEKKDSLVSVATPLVRMRWPLPEKVVIVYFACKPFRKLTGYRSKCQAFSIENTSSTCTKYIATGSMATTSKSCRISGSVVSPTHCIAHTTRSYVFYARARCVFN